MNWKLALDALALMLVLEGLCPFVSPAKYRQFLLLMIAQSTTRMRAVGLALMIAGLIVCLFIHGGGL